MFAGPWAGKSKRDFKMKARSLLQLSFVARAEPLASEKVQPPHALPRITFVLPRRGASGGTRVTVEMANRLLHRGYDVRIACRSLVQMSLRGLRQQLRMWRWQMSGGAHNDWLRHYHGPLAWFHNLQEVGFEPGELVIAVGSFTIADVYALQGDICKLRYCHGFREDLPDFMRQVWTVSMPTIAVSPTLSARVEQYCGTPPLELIPNGLSMEEYFDEHRTRDGIGIIYSSNYKKNPEFIFKLLHACAERLPHIPLYSFGTEVRPREMPRRVQYVRSPSLEKARELYNRSMIWLVASRSEGFSLPILEAMACGCCVLSTDHDSASGIVSNGKNGLLLPVDQTEAFLQAIERLVYSDAERQAMIEAGKKKAQSFSWDHATDRMEQFLCRFHQQCARGQHNGR